MTAGEQTLRRPPRYRPSWGGACLCGSGRRYHACCRDNLPGFERGRAFTGAWAIADWKGGLTAIRADVTQYTIWHRSHTAPPGRVLPDALRFGSLFIVDIAALSELVADLVQTYFQLGRQAELDRVLGRLAGNIDDPRWARKILYHRGIVALGMDRRTVAQARVRELGPITASEADLDVLQLSLDVNSDELGFSERRALLDRVLELTSSPADKIQYSGAKAFGLLMVDDRQGAKAELTKIFFKQLRVIGSTMGTREELARLARFVAERGIQPRIDSVIPLAEARTGFERMVRGDVSGKIVFRN